MSSARAWARTIELFVFIALLALGGTAIVSASWIRDYAQPRVTLLGAGRGISVLVTAGSTRVLIVEGTDPAELGNAVAKARHPGLDRIDLLIISGNAAASGFAPRVIGLLDPRSVLSVGSAASLAPLGLLPEQIIDRSMEIELEDGVTISIDLWPAVGAENEDVTWAARIERGGAAVYWVSDREALIQNPPSERVDVTIIGRGRPAGDTPLPLTRAIVVPGESITGPELRSVALASLGPETQTCRVFAGEAVRIDLNPEGIRTVPGAIPAGTPSAD